LEASIINPQIKRVSLLKGKYNRSGKEVNMNRRSFIGGVIAGLLSWFGVKEAKAIPVRKAGRKTMLAEYLPFHTSCYKVGSDAKSIEVVHTGKIKWQNAETKLPKLNPGWQRVMAELTGNKEGTECIYRIRDKKVT
jgi:hypothetical protein